MIVERPYIRVSVPNLFNCPNISKCNFNKHQNYIEFIQQKNSLSPKQLSNELKNSLYRIQQAVSEPIRNSLTIVLFDEADLVSLVLNIADFDENHSWDGVSYHI